MTQDKLRSDVLRTAGIEFIDENENGRCPLANGNSTMDRRQRRITKSTSPGFLEE